MIEILLAAAQVNQLTLTGLRNHTLAEVETTLGVKLTPLGRNAAGFDVYVYFRTPDHSQGSPWLMVGLKDGKVGDVAWATGHDGPLWLGPAFAHPIPQMPVTKELIRPFVPRAGKLPATPRPTQDLKLAPQTPDEIPDQPLIPSDDERGDLPGNLVN